MEVLVLDGKNYVKASKAARELGYATDYVGQLCRGGHVDAHLIGRTWYVNQEELSTHRVEKKRMSRVKAREQAKKAIEEHKTKTQNTQNTQNTYRNLDIQYESDTEDLIPKVRKVPVASLPVVHGGRSMEVDELETDDLTYENKGEKIQMSGTLDVVDVTDGLVDEDTVFLTPRIRHSTATELAAEYEEKPRKQSFIDRIQEGTIENTEEIAIDPENTDTSKLVGDNLQPVVDQVISDDATEIESVAALEPVEHKKKGMILLYMTVIALLVSIVVLSIGVTKISKYSYESKVSSVEYQFDKDNYNKIIHLKIKISR
jgi:hypothetical protein